MNHLRDPQTKEEAIAFVSEALLSPTASPTSRYREAMDVSREFDLKATDILVYRRKKARNT